VNATTCSDALVPVEWHHGPGCALETTVGSATFLYFPSEMRMHWRGKDYYGVASEDIDNFVRNRTDR